MNGYDFDKTILKGNSVRRFFAYCLLRFPYLILLLPMLLVLSVLFTLKIINKHRYLDGLELFLLFVPNKSKNIEKFWDKNIKHVQKWYLDTRTDEDVIISASPAFIVEPACRRLGVKCLATEKDVKTCKTANGKHCYGEEKVVRYRQEFGDLPLECYYSDSWSDEPSFAFAKRGYLVRGEGITLVYENGKKICDK